jgi:hypothetical protein
VWLAAQMHSRKEYQDSTPRVARPSPMFWENALRYLHEPVSLNRIGFGL